MTGMTLALLPGRVSEPVGDDRSPKRCTIRAVSPLTPEARRLRIATARRSPELANAHDERAWLELYASNAVVEDPVGSPRCQRGVFTRRGSRDDLERFYRVFIAPTSIRVEERGDTVVGDTVMREVVLHVRLSGGARASIHAFLEYDLIEERGALRVRRMRAYWDAPRNGREVLAQGLAGKLTSLMSAVRLLRYFGRRWTSRYMTGTKRGIRREGPIKLAALEKALAAGDAGGLDAIAAKGAQITLPGAAACELRGLDGAALKLSLGAPICSGFHAVATCRAQHAGAEVSGVAIASFDEATRLLTEVRLLWEDAPLGG
jgi:hypothetical protein